MAMGAYHCIVFAVLQIAAVESQNQPVLSVQNVMPGETAYFDCANIASTSQLKIEKGNELIYDCLNFVFTCSALNPDPDYSHVTFTGIDTPSGKGTFTVDNANQARDGGNWTCTYKTSSMSPSVTFVVVVKISGISWVSPVVGSNNTVNVTSDKPTSFQCQTTQGRPAANITWYLDNIPLSGGSTATKPVSGDMVITIGYLTLTVNRTAEGKVLSCRATNYVKLEPLESTVKPAIRVKYAPSGPPIIDEFDNGTVYKTRVGRPQSLMCHVPTAYPVPTLSWSCPSYTVTGTTALSGSTDRVNVSITWIATSTDPGQTCQCTSYQEVSGTVTTYINIDVLYPPSPPTYQLNMSAVSTDSIDVIQGDTVHLTCNTISNPSPSIDQYIWTRSKGGSWTHDQQKLTVTNIDRSSDDTYTCEVNNTMTTLDRTSDTGRNTSQITVHVLYPPSSPTYRLNVSGVPTDVSGRIDVIQGDTVSLTCNTVSNPPPSTDQYRWTRSIIDSWTHGQEQSTITHINISDAAVYTCTVNNTMTPTVGGTRTGTNQSVIAVNVLYLPYITGHTDRDVVEHQTATISCTADGVPATYTFYNWTHLAPDNLTLLRSLSGTYNDTTTTLRLSDVNYQDTGYYTCNVSNGVRHYITGETTATTDVMFTVNSVPITVSLEGAAGRKNGSSTLTVKFYSNDGTVPTVTWRKSSKQTVSNITDIRFEYSVNVSNVTLTMYGHLIEYQHGFIGSLSVHNITQEDFTNYSCQISNTIGSITVYLALKPEGPPDPPKELRTTSTDSSITLFWLSGFHGGADQTFTVEYSTTTETVFKVAANVSGGQKEGVQFNTTIQKLSSDTHYVIQITYSNRFGQQKEIVYVETLTAPDMKTDTPKPSLGPIIGGAVGGLVGIGVVVGVVVVLFRRGLPAKTPSHRPNTDRNRANLPVEPGIPMDTKTYENRTFVDAKGVRIHELYDYIMEHIADDAEALKKEFFKLKNGLIADHKVGEMKQNKAKNRYKNMIAYDDSRVHLEDRDEQQTDYINACHILGYEKVSKFIASQGPTKVMVGDFWQMVWQEDTGKIVMLTNLMELGAVKCIQYWPEVGSVVYGDITVSLKGVDKHPDYTIRSLDIRKGDESPHRVEQFHFQAWPDKNVPDSAWSLVSFWMEVTTCHSRHKGPTVVHCSAGVGRTGTYIALDWLYNQAHVEGVVNYFDCVDTLRRQRVNMVQTPMQYAYLHETVAESLCFGTLPLLTNHYRQWYAHMLEKIDHPWNKSGNPCSRLEIQHELYLQSMGDYENGACQGIGSAEAATYLLKNYMEKAVFLVVNTVRRDADTTLPRIAADRNIKLIINLSDGVLNIDGNRTTVKTFDVTTWGDNGTPATMSEVVALIEDVLKVQPRQTEVSPIMLYSNYPVERCGLICILLNEIQRMKIDGQLSILQSAKSLKSVDGRFVVAPNLAQFKFCHDVILEYLNQAEIYQNVPT